jgi:hypothetical protein
VRKHHFTDIPAIAKEIETKSLEEVEEYLKVFMVRFGELKEKDLILEKI